MKQHLSLGSLRLLPKPSLVFCLGEAFFFVIYLFFKCPSFCIHSCKVPHTVSDINATERGSLNTVRLAVGSLIIPQREAASVERRASSLHRQCTELEKELDERTKALATYSGQVGLIVR